MEKMHIKFNDCILIANCTASYIKLQNRMKYVPVEYQNHLDSKQFKQPSYALAFSLSEHVSRTHNGLIIDFEDHCWRGAFKGLMLTHSSINLLQDHIVGFVFCFQLCIMQQ